MPANESTLSGCVFNRPPSTILVPRSLVQPSPKQRLAESVEAEVGQSDSHSAEPD